MSLCPPRTKALVLELLAAVCLVRGGHEIILSAFDNFKEVPEAASRRPRPTQHPSEVVLCMIVWQNMDEKNQTLTVFNEIAQCRMWGVFMSTDGVKARLCGGLSQVINLFETPDVSQPQIEIKINSPTGATGLQTLAEPRLIQSRKKKKTPQSKTPQRDAVDPLVRTRWCFCDSSLCLVRQQQLHRSDSFIGFVSQLTRT